MQYNWKSILAPQTSRRSLRTLTSCLTTSPLQTITGYLIFTLSTCLTNYACKHINVCICIDVLRRSSRILFFSFFWKFRFLSPFSPTLSLFVFILFFFFDNHRYTLTVDDGFRGSTIHPRLHAGDRERMQNEPAKQREKSKTEGGKRETKEKKKKNLDLSPYCNPTSKIEHLHFYRMRVDCIRTSLHTQIYIYVCVCPCWTICTIW